MWGHRRVFGGATCGLWNIQEVRKAERTRLSASCVPQSTMWTSADIQLMYRHTRPVPCFFFIGAPRRYLDVCAHTLARTSRLDGLSNKCSNDDACGAPEKHPMGWLAGDGLLVSWRNTSLSTHSLMWPCSAQGFWQSQQSFLSTLLDINSHSHRGRCLHRRFSAHRQPPAKLLHWEPPKSVFCVTSNDNQSDVHASFYQERPCYAENF